jgi:hypothetical protein
MLGRHLDGRILMKVLRAVVCGMFLGGVLPLAVAAGKQDAMEKRFALPAGQTMVIKWNAGWADIAVPTGAPPGTVTFSGPDASKMRVMLVPLPPDPNFTGEAGNLRMLARNMARELEESGGEVNPEQLPIEGPNVRGFYVKGIDHKPKPGEFGFIYAGPIAISSRPYVFQILWNAGGEAPANAALAALETLRIQ